MLGHYIAFKPTHKSLHTLVSLINTIDLLPKIQPEHLHCTLIHCSHTIDHHYLISPNSIHNALITKAELFNNTLIFKLESNDLFNQFHLALSKGLIHDFPDYYPHISIAYQLNDIDSTQYLNILNKFIDTGIHIQLSHEYIEPINHNYSP